MEAIRFMYFANNFSQEQLKGCFNATSAPQHIEDKWKGYCLEIPNRFKTGTDVFFHWFMQLDRENQKAVVAYINANYTGIRD